MKKVVVILEIDVGSMGRLSCAFVTTLQDSEALKTKTFDIGTCLGREHPLYVQVMPHEVRVIEDESFVKYFDEHVKSIGFSPFKPHN